MSWVEFQTRPEELAVGAPSTLRETGHHIAEVRNLDDKPVKDVRRREFGYAAASKRVVPLDVAYFPQMVRMVFGDPVTGEVAL